MCCKPDEGVVREVFEVCLGRLLIGEGKSSALRLSSVKGLGWIWRCDTDVDVEADEVNAGS